jgi:cytochrome c553
MPKLAGQRSDYLYSQLLAFRSGVREHAVTVAPLTDVEAQDLAKYYSTQKREPDPARDAELEARGKRVYFANASSISGCITCHDSPGRSGIGRMGGVTGSTNTPTPKLNGQDAAYLLGRLESFANGRRESAVMGPIAASMSEEDRRAVAIYLSTQPQM